MAPSFLPKFIWHLRRSPAYLGAPGCIAIGLLVLSVAFYMSAVLPQQKQIDDLRQDAESLRLDARMPVADIKRTDPVEQLSSFYKLLPAAATAPDWLSKLYHAGKRQSLTLEQAEYRLTHDQDGKFWRYEITLPVKGGYLPIRKFVTQALADIPHLSLDSISYQRQKIGEATIESQLKFTLFLGEGA